MIAGRRLGRLLGDIRALRAALWKHAGYKRPRELPSATRGRDRDAKRPDATAWNFNMAIALALQREDAAPATPAPAAAAPSTPVAEAAPAPPPIATAAEEVTAPVAMELEPAAAPAHSEPPASAARYFEDGHVRVGADGHSKWEVVGQVGLNAGASKWVLVSGPPPRAPCATPPPWCSATLRWQR